LEWFFIYSRNASSMMELNLPFLLRAREHERSWFRQDLIITWESTNSYFHLVSLLQLASALIGESLRLLFEMAFQRACERLLLRGSLRRLFTTFLICSLSSSPWASLLIPLIWRDSSSSCTTSFIHFSKSWRWKWNSIERTSIVRNFSRKSPRLVATSSVGSSRLCRNETLRELELRAHYSRFWRHSFYPRALPQTRSCLCPT